MAGLTKEQRAQRAAEAAALQSQSTQEQPTDLVRVTKDGETLDVHPTCVAAHQEAGWKLA